MQNLLSAGKGWISTAISGTLGRIEICEKSAWGVSMLMWLFRKNSVWVVGKWQCFESSYLQEAAVLGWKVEICFFFSLHFNSRQSHFRVFELLEKFASEALFLPCHWGFWYCCWKILFLFAGHLKSVRMWASTKKRAILQSRKARNPSVLPLQFFDEAFVSCFICIFWKVGGGKTRTCHFKMAFKIKHKIDFW